MPRSGPGGPTGRPLSRRSPAVAGSKPPRMCRNVLLPHPDGPTMETNSCSSIASDRRSIAVTLRLSTVNVLSRSVTSSSGIVTDLSSLQVDAKQCRALSALPSPLWGGVGGGGGALRTQLGPARLAQDKPRPGQARGAWGREQTEFAAHNFTPTEIGFPFTSAGS